MRWKSVVDETEKQQSKLQSSEMSSVMEAARGVSSAW